MRLISLYDIDMDRFEPDPWWSSVERINEESFKGRWNLADQVHNGVENEIRHIFGGIIIPAFRSSWTGGWYGL